MAVSGAALFEQGPVHSVCVPAIEFTAFAVPVDTVALDVSKMGSEGGLAEALPSACYVEFHHDAPHAKFRVRRLAKLACPSRAAATGHLSPAESGLAGP
ncbi:MAG: hypothetical protein KDA43_06270 [Hyphomonas sp.]|nr:hypothetical protein [Hyphomonas sp.]GGD20626.1 hypothetical protein GCM10011587_26510 [Pyruvatibacter mobilis]